LIGGFSETNLMLYIFMHFSINLVKVREAWVRTKLKWPTPWNGGSIGQYFVAIYLSLFEKQNCFMLRCQYLPNAKLKN
jgi:hypothetical protein